MPPTKIQNDPLLSSYGAAMTPQQIAAARAAGTYASQAPSPAPTVQPTPLASPTPATTITPPTNLNLPTPNAPVVQSQYFSGISTSVDNARTALQSELDKQTADAAAQQAQLDAEKKTALDAEQQLSTPFRASLEAAQAPKVNKNLDAAQGLVDELDTLAQQAGDILANSSGSYATLTSRNAASSKTLGDITARTGVIQAAIAANYGQVGQINSEIDRAVAATTADRQDQLDYYNTILSLNEQGQLKLDDESKTIAQEKVSLLQSDLDDAQKTADTIKQAMLDPDTAQAYAQAGVTLNDTPEEINQKLASYGYAKELADTSNSMASNGYTALVPGQKAPAGAQIVSVTDSQGKQKQFYSTSAAPVVSSPQDAGNGPVLTLSGRPLNASQALAYGYGQRMAAADQILHNLGGNFTGLLSYVTGASWFPNALKSDERQQLEQAERDFANAVLRHESGAAISPSEFDSAAQQYFPQAGDSAAVLAQKAQNRQQAIESMAVSANVSTSQIGASGSQAAPDATGGFSGTTSSGLQYEVVSS